MGDVRGGREGSDDRHADVPRFSNQAVDAVEDGLVVDQPLEGAGIAEIRIGLCLRGTRPETRPPQQMFDQRFAPCHARPPLGTIDPAECAEVKKSRDYKTRAKPNSSSPFARSP